MAENYGNINRTASLKRAIVEARLHRSCFISRHLKVRPKRASPHCKKWVGRLLNGLSWIIPRSPKLSSVLGHQNDRPTQTPWAELGSYKAKKHEKTPPKSLPGRQKEKLPPEEMVSQDVAPGHPPDRTETSRGITSGCARRQNLHLVEHLGPFLCTYAFEKMQAGKEVVEVRKTPDDNPTPEFSFRSFLTA